MDWLYRQVQNVVSRGVVKIVDAAKKMQVIQGTVCAGEVRDGMEHFEPYGFTSRPFSEAECVVLNVGASSDHSIVIVAADRRYRVTGLAEGEVCFYDDQGQRVTLKRAGIEVEAPMGKYVAVNALDVRLGTGADSPATRWTELATFIGTLLASLSAATAPPGGGALTWSIPLPAPPAAGATTVKVK